MQSFPDFTVNEPDCERASVLARQAMTKSEAGEVQSAITLIEEAIRLDSITALNNFHALRAKLCKSIGQDGPEKAIEMYQHAIHLSNFGRFQESQMAYRNASSLDPAFLWPLNNLAWMLSTSRERSARNGPQAVRCALEACQESNWNCWAFVETLAAAYAEAGDFDRAAGWQQACLKIMPAENRPDSERVLRCFQLRQPYVEEDKAVAAGVQPGTAEADPGARKIQPHDYGQLCWWCGNPSDSQEHRYKKADITRLFGKGPYKGDESLARYIYGEERSVQGPHSKELMFKANLCQKCNNERSQPFDRAYDQFITYFEANTALILASKQIRFSHIFGADWHDGRENVIRYYVKHIGCRLAEGGVRVDARVMSYLDGKGPLSCIELNFEIREDILAMEAKLRADQLTGNGVWIGDGMADYHPSSNTYSRFYSHVGYRWLRLNYQYDESFTSKFNVEPGDLLILTTGYSVDPASFS